MIAGAEDCFQIMVIELQALLESGNFCAGVPQWVVAAEEEEVAWEGLEDCLKFFLGNSEETAGRIQVDIKAAEGGDDVLPVLVAAEVGGDDLEFGEAAFNGSDFPWAAGVLFGWQDIADMDHEGEEAFHGGKEWE